MHTRNRNTVLRVLLVIPVILAILLTSMLPLTSHAAYNREMKFTSDIVYMISLDQNTVIFSKNANKKTPMASLTKITTALVTLGHEKDLNRKVTVTQDMLDELKGTNSSTAGLVVGEVFTIRQLLNLMLVKSANDAAVVLAHAEAGTTDKFVAMMNQFAKDRGCKNTHYVNPHGLDAAGHYTTAVDLSKIIRYGLKNSTFRQIVAQPYYQMPKTNQRPATKFPNTNDLLKPGSTYYYKPCRGIKTGTTDSAGHCLASYATKNGYTYLCIILSGPKAYAANKSTNIAFKETKAAYEWVFSNIKLRVVADPSDVVAVAPVNLSRDVDHVRLVPAREVTALIPANIDSSGIALKVIKGSLPDNIHAPIKKGDIIGKAYVMYAGDVLSTVDLAAADDIHQSFFGSIGYGIKRFFSFTVVQVLLILAVLGVGIYFLLKYLRGEKKKADVTNIVRIKHGITDDHKSVRLVSTDYGQKTKQPKPKKPLVPLADESERRPRRIWSKFSSKRYNNSSRKYKGGSFRRR